MTMQHKKPPARRVALAALANEGVTRQRVERLEAILDAIVKDIPVIKTEPWAHEVDVKLCGFVNRSFWGRLRWFLRGR